MAVLHHPCGRREVVAAGEQRQPCPACERLFGQVEAGFRKAAV